MLIDKWDDFSSTSTCYVCLLIVLMFFFPQSIYSNSHKMEFFYWETCSFSGWEKIEFLYQAYYILQSAPKVRF